MLGSTSKIGEHVMPRYARLYYPGGTFHIVSRCLNRDFLIEGRGDREKYLQLLGATLARCDATLLAWCLMSNHIHLVVRAGEDPLEKLVKPLHTGYAGWKNKQVARLGPVFAGRFKSPLVDEEAYLLELVRYVHNNPVRAGLVASAEQSPWSSHRAYLGLDRAPAWLNAGEVLSRFASKSDESRQAFADFVAEGVGEPRRPELSGVSLERTRREVAPDVGDAWRLSQPVVGSEEFATKVMDDLREREKAKRPEGKRRHRRPTLEELISHTCAALELEDWEFEQLPKRLRPRTARMIVTWLWVRVFEGTQAQIARALQTYSGRVSSWYGQAVRNLPELEPLMDDVLRTLPDAPPLSSWKIVDRVHYHLATDEEPGRKS
jgi:REP element-mobilizing transposase RayT